MWIFQATSDLITASSSSVGFIKGGQPCNVFWQVTSSATLGSGSTFVGTILALTSITMNDGVTVNGRALARNGTVTLINDTITRSTCSTPTPTPTPTTAPTTAPTAAPTAAPTTAPTAAPTASPTPVLASLPGTATLEDGALFVILAVLVIVFAVLWMVVRARRRASHPAP